MAGPKPINNDIQGRYVEVGGYLELERDCRLSLALISL
jgi:hypothetical protein